MNTDQIKLALGSYVRAAVSSAVALYMSGITDPKTLLNALVAGLVGPLAKAVNPKDKSFGLGANK